MPLFYAYHNLVWMLNEEVKKCNLLTTSVLPPYRKDDPDMIFNLNKLIRECYTQINVFLPVNDSNKFQFELIKRFLDDVILFKDAILHL